MEMVKIKGGGTVFLSEDSGDGDVFESVIEVGPFVIESDHVFDTFFTLLLERCGGGGLGEGVQYRCSSQTDCLRFLQWE